jgi:hypothetical protein
VGTLSVLRFIPMGVFDGATIRTIGKAFDAACKELRDGGQPAVVHEVMIKRIIAAARKGERNVTRLRDAALTGLREPRNQIRGLATIGRLRRASARWCRATSVTSAVQGGGKRRDPQEGCALR